MTQVLAFDSNIMLRLETATRDFIYAVHLRRTALISIELCLFRYCRSDAICFVPEDGYLCVYSGFIVYTAPTEEDSINEEEEGRDFTQLAYQ